MHLLLTLLFFVSCVAAAIAEEVDTAIVVAVDVSQSVDERRYRLQMQGIAAALEQPDVINAILSGANGSILFSMVAWADRTDVVIPWQKLASPDDTKALANRIRALPVHGGEFTCLARMLRVVRTTIFSEIPIQARRLVLDVSGDGIDNCDNRQATMDGRDSLVAAGLTINALPIVIEGQNVVGSGAYRAPGFGLQELGPDTDTTTLNVWYAERVIGGPGAFLLPANGYTDFGRAFRQKFVTEISNKESGLAARAVLPQKH